MYDSRRYCVAPAIRSQISFIETSYIGRGHGAQRDIQGAADPWGCNFSHIHSAESSWTGITDRDSSSSDFGV